MPESAIPPKPEVKPQEKPFWKRGNECLLPPAIGLVTTLFALLLWQVGVFNGLELLAYDELFDLRHSLHRAKEKAWLDQASREIVIIEYDDVSKSLLRIKGTPPRRFFSKVIERTMGLGKVVGFDYYFPRQAYPDSRTAEIDANLRYNALKLLENFQGLQLAPGQPERGLARFSEKYFLSEMGFFQEPGPEELEGIDPDRWSAFKAEILRRQEETAETVIRGEAKFDALFRKLDPGLVEALEGEGEDFTRIARCLSGTVVNTLFLDDIRLGKQILWAQNVVLARFIDEGGFSIQESDPMFRVVADGEGLINTVKDVDGRLRSIPLVRMTGESDLEFALSLATVLSAFGLPPHEIVLGTGTRAGSFALPEDLILNVNFIGGPRSLPYIPLYRFFPDEIDPDARAELERSDRTVAPPVKDEELRGRIILVGDTTKDGQDFIATPVSHLRDVAEGEVKLDRSRRGTLLEMPGVEIHAHAVFNILHDTWLREPSVFASVLICLLLGAVSLLFYWPRVGFLLAGLAFFVIAAAVFAVSYLSFANAYTVFPLVPALAVVAFNFVGGVSYQGILQQMKKKAVTSMFGKYVSDNLVQKMVSGELEVDLKGREKELTVLFSDIRGFTRLSEGLDPETVSQILHEYFSRMIRTIFTYGGTLDKLMGDAVMAFFGDPEDMPVHPRKAADAALAMLEALGELQKSSEYPAMAGLDIGIGLNTGRVTVGNLGSDEYFDYTVIGDNVNLGSRLEGLNKQYNTRIIISESTYRPIAEEYECRRLGRVTVAGRTKPVEIHELLGKKGTIPEEKLLAKALFEEGLSLWEKGEFSTASGILAEAVERFDDGPSKTFLKLSREYADAPPEDWAGVFIPKGK